MSGYTMKLKLIAGYLVAQGANETTEANWSFTKEEVEELLEREATDKILHELEVEISKYEGVAAVEIDYHDEEPYVDITYYMSYCGCE